MSGSVKSENRQPGSKCWCVFVCVALQSPIEYQKSGGGTTSSLTRNRSASGNRLGTSHSRPSSAVGLGDKEAERGRTQMKVSTSNGGSTCFDPRVSSSGLTA